MPTLRSDISAGLRLEVMGRDNLDEDFFKIALAVFFAELLESAFGEELSAVDDANDVAELFDFAHDVSGEDDGFALIATFADEGDDGARGHDVEAKGGLIENHHRGIVDQRAGDGGLLLHAGRKFVAAAVAEFVHVQAVENAVHTLFQRGLVEAVEAAEVFDDFLGGEARVESGGGGKKTDAGADFFGLLDDIVAANERGGVGGLKNRSEYAQRGGFSGAIGAEQPVDFSGFAAKTDVIHGPDLSAFFVAEALGQTAGFNHG